MAEISCPMCGKANPAERDVCQYCEARLKPLTDELSRSQPPIKPGDEPKELDTGQLESALPKWLRDVRQQSRESAGDEEGQPPAEKEARPQESDADLLAGLRSKAEDEDEIPTWLAGLRGEGEKAPYEETSKGEDQDDMAALRSMLGESAPAAPEEESSPLPDWMAELGASEEGQAGADQWSTLRQEGAAEPPQSEQPSFTSDSDFRWEADFGSDSAPQAESADEEKSFDTELPAWLQDTNEPQIGATDTGLPSWLGGEERPAGEEESAPMSFEGDLPAWLQDKDEPSQDESADTGTPVWMGSESPATPSQDEAQTPPIEGELPSWLASLGEGESGEDAPSQSIEEPAAKSTTDWLASFDEESTKAEPPQPPESAIKSTTDWLASLDEEAPGTVPQPSPALPADEGEMPDWLSSLGAEDTQEPRSGEPEEPVASEGLPSWLAALGEESSEPLPQEGYQTPGEVDMPDWLDSHGEESTASEAEGLSPSEQFAEPSQIASEAELPGWLASLGETTGESTEPAEEPEIPALASDLQADEAGTSPTFVDDEGQPIATEDMEAIFSMGMPDWLSDAQGITEEGSELPAAEAQEDELRPAELPGWVQAMRPVESVISETEKPPTGDEPVEEQGPLAGLRGVLPAVAGVGPSSKPKSYSVKLQASEDQQASAALLEKLLAEEVNPEPVAAQRVVPTQRILRWIIAAVLLLVVGAAVYYSPQVSRIPNSVPPETKAVLDFVGSSLPANAPVLVVFDYEAARAGEMEAAAAPLIDQMLTLKSPRLSLVSSTPAGSGLAERFMNILRADRPLARNENFINLGYLPGGAAGVQAFAGDPAATKQFATSGEAAWSTPVLQNVGALSDFAAIILLTDDVETARIWIEQTEGNRGEARLLVVSSAQSGPMIRPYLRSGQVYGMVTGLEGSAPIEQANSERPGMARRYWDAYGFGLLAAVFMITIGSLWSLVSGFQASRKEQRKK
jgi:hypothetical protein